LMNSSKYRFINILVGIAMLAGAVMACDLSSETASTTDEATSLETSTSDENAPSTEPLETNQTGEAPAPVVKNGETWTVMLYQDADDQILEEDIFTDLNEAERVGSTDKVNLVAQIDRYKGGFKGKQNFSGAKRFYLTQDDNLDLINSEELDDLGEVNMADGKTLVDFTVWAMQTYPADNYALILSDHGSGWPGGWTDSDSGSKPRDIQIDGFDDMLYLNEIDAALAEITKQTGVEKLDIIGFDACLMSSLEVLSTTAPYARYAILSQETEPSMGWAYSAFLNKLVKNPKQDASELAKTIVASYIEEDMLIVDDNARAKYVARTYEGGDSISAAQLVKEETKTVTLSAIDLSAIPNVMSMLDDLVQSMSKINQKVVAGSRSHARSYESVFGEDYPSPFIDLGNFVKLLQKESTSENVGKAAQQVQSAIKRAVIAEKHGPNQKGATGISIYFPNSKLFNVSGSDYATYTATADRFAATSLWDDYLTFHYTGQPIVANNTPEVGTMMVGPGAEKITVKPIELSGDVASSGNPVTLSTTVSGSNLSYLYIFTGRLTKDQDMLQIVDIDYIDSEATKEIDGMIYPDWGTGEIPIEMDWEPLLYVVNDGSHKQMVLLEPDTFGVGTEDSLYTVDGYYEFANDEPRRYARLTFNGDGSLLNVMGFNSTENIGPQHEITPEIGDRFKILSQWIPMGENQESVITYKESGYLTFGETPWEWEEHAAAKGEYLVGIIAEDMDGNNYEEYVQVTAE
jgi:clostripain